MGERALSAASGAPAEGPTELFDLDLGEEHWIRADLCSRSQAKARCMRELDVDSPLRLGVGKAWVRVDDCAAADALADGVTEPYDGWPMVGCTENSPGAVAYWHVWRLRGSAPGAVPGAPSSDETECA